MKNCRRCTRWRPLSDYETVVYQPTPYITKEYTRHVCEPCERKRKREGYARLTERERRARRRYQRKGGKL